MTMHSPIRRSGSLLERADAAYDFRKHIGAAPAASTILSGTGRGPSEAGGGARSEFPAGDVPLPHASHGSPPPAGEDLQRCRQAQIDRALLAANQLLVPGAAPGALGEEFRLAKRQLLLEARRNDKARMILIASSQSGEGKTWVALNLALSLAAEPDVEVLLVDGDFAKPEVLARLGVADSPGLMDALTDSARDVQSLIVATDVPRLSLLPAGARTHGDAEALASERTRAVITGLLTADPRRIVVFDSPPALAASHASVLAMHAGQTVMVVKADTTTEADLRDSLALLAACPTVQLLLNRTRFAAGARRFGSYYPEGATDAP